MKIDDILINLIENPLINITFFGGLVFIIAGFIMFKFPPKKINAIYGYRTSSSMESQEKWDFAQKYSSKEMIKLGFLLCLTCLFNLINNFNNFTNMIIGLCLLILMVIILLLKVEKAIKKKFDNH